MANGGWWDAVPYPGGLWTVTRIDRASVTPAMVYPGFAVAVFSGPVGVATMEHIVPEDQDED